MRIRSIPDAPARKAPSPGGLLLLTALATFAAATLVVYALVALPAQPPLAAALIEASVLVIVTLPILFYGWFRILRGEREARERYGQSVEARALHDATTGLPNRLGFHKSVEKELQGAVRSHGAFAIVLFDVRRFGDINGTLGHRSGDLLLRQIGERLQSSASAFGMAARLGSDIFGVLLSGVARDRVEGAVEKLHRLLEAPFHVEGTTIEIEAHAGFALFPRHGDDGDVLVQRAEVALQHAKKTGLRSAEFEEDTDARTRRGLRMIGLLRAAIELGELSLVYQPKVAVATGEPAGVEALVRWDTPDFGPVSPGEFIPLAEQAGLMKPLTSWVLGEALRQMSVWRSAGLEVKVAVNLSTQNLADTGFARQVGALLTQWEVPARWLTFELTESAVMEDPERAAVVVEDLEKLGVDLSIDDFGTGYGSLTYLRTLPAAELKLDRSFVRDVDTNRENATIVRAVTELAHGLGLRVVAEGVENSATMERLRAAQVDFAQGYAIARPLSARDVTTFFEQARREMAAAPEPHGPTVLWDPSLPREVRRPSLRDVLRSLRPIPRTSIPVA